MNTTQNRAAGAAIVIRGVIARLRQPAEVVNGRWKDAAMSLSDRVADESAVLEGVVEELEQSAAPDPDGATRGA